MIVEELMRGWPIELNDTNVSVESPPISLANAPTSPILGGTALFPALTRHSGVVSVYGVFAAAIACVPKG